MLMDLTIFNELHFIDSYAKIKYIKRILHD